MLVGVIKLGATPAAAAGECGHDGVYLLLLRAAGCALLARVLTLALQQCALAAVR